MGVLGVVQGPGKEAREHTASSELVGRKTDPRVDCRGILFPQRQRRAATSDMVKEKVVAGCCTADVAASQPPSCK